MKTNGSTRRSARVTRDRGSDEVGRDLPESYPAWKSAAWLGALAIVVALSWVGWGRIARIRVADIRVEGAVLAAVEDVRKAARIDADTLLVSIAPSLVDDRVRRHPWVASASTRRLPDGTVAIRVRERRPVLLVIGASGRPYHYIDREGRRMPFVPGHAFMVPVLRGLEESYHPVRPVQQPAVRELAAALDGLDPDVDALVSEFVVGEDGGIVLVTTPASGGQTLRVRLGRDGFARRLARLREFWDQAVLTRPEVRFASVDLRFEGQIITRESSPEGG